MKKLISFLVIISIFCSFASLTTFASSETQTDTFSSAKDILSEYIDVEEFSNYILEGIQNCQAEIDVSSYNIPNSSDVVDALSTQISKNIPQTFHVASMGYSYSNKIHSLSFEYECDVNQYKQLLAECEKAADEMLVGIAGNEDLSDVEKALLIHDRLAVWCEYDNTRSSESHDIQRVFTERTAVCDGYALAYIFLLEKVGIESEYCSSDVLVHAWNIVYIDGKPYHVDVTWDDNGQDIDGHVDHENFLRSTNGIIETNHIKDGIIDFDTTPTDTTYDEYYWQNSNTEFQVVGDEIYYLDNVEQSLKKVGDTTSILSVNDIWYAGSNSYWPGNYSRLAHDGKYLYYSTSKAVYEYDTVNKISKKVFEPDLSIGDFFSIYGMTYEDGYIICNLSNTPNFTPTTKADYSVKKLYPENCIHSFTQEGVCENCCATIFHESTKITSFDTSTSGDVLVPLKIGQDFVKSIGESAFKDCTRITCITLPNSVNTISSKAFENCTSLKKIILNDNVTSISDDAFNGANKDLTFVCYKGSPASVWAIEHGFSVEYTPIPYGNINGKGGIDIFDLISLAKYIVGAESYIDIRAANVNAPDEENRTVDIMDLISLAKYICSSNIQLGPQ